jgi:hypothetical protein
MALLMLTAIPIAAISPGIPVVADDQPSLRITAEALIKKLDSASLMDRTRAEKDLLDLGPDVLTFLPSPELIASVSARESIKRLRVQLERRAARESAQASHVKFVDETTVGELLKLIVTQTRNRIELADDSQHLSKRKMTVDFDNRPFWDCVDEVCRQLNARTSFNVQQGVLQLQTRQPGDPKELQVQRAGPYRMAVTSVEVRPIVGDPKERLLRISTRISLEPRLRPLFLHFAAADLSAVGSNGKSLATWNPAATYELPVGDAGREVPVQFDYRLPVDDNRREIAIHGRLAVQLAAGTERIVFDQTSLAAGTMRRRGGVTVRLRDITTEQVPGDAGTVEIKVAVVYDAGGPAFESHRTWMFHNAVYLESEAGQRLDFTEYDTSLQGNGAIGVDYRWTQFAGPLNRYRFVYEAPTLILDLPLDVKLENIPIPLDTPKRQAP